MFILVTIFLPQGVLGLIEGIRRRTRAGRRRRCSPSLRSSAMATETQLYLQDVHRSFDGYKAINGLSIAIAKGELRAVVGPNGAGKTTMLDIITGKTRPDSGRVIWDEDVDLTKLDEADTARLGIGRKFQKPTVFETLSVEANMMLALAGQRGVAATLFHKLSRARGAADRRAAGAGRADRGARAAGRRASATARSSGSRSACCWRRSRSSCSSTSRRRG